MKTREEEKQARRQKAQDQLDQIAEVFGQEFAECIDRLRGGLYPIPYVECVFARIEKGLPVQPRSKMSSNKVMYPEDIPKGEPQ